VIDHSPQSSILVPSLVGHLRQITVNDLPVGRNVDEILRLIKAFQFVEEFGEVCPANWQPGDLTMKADPNESKKYFSGKHTGQKSEGTKNTKDRRQRNRILPFIPCLHLFLFAFYRNMHVSKIVPKCLNFLAWDLKSLVLVGACRIVCSKADFQFFYAISVAANPAGSAAAGGKGSAIPEVSDKAAFTAATSSSGLTVVDYWAPWCKNCTKIANNIEAIAAATTGAKFIKVNTNVAVELAAENGVGSLPSFQFFKNGAKVGEYTGSNVAAFETALKAQL
jgi:thiol-disulfide isomerase/thioredoxin